ncbi:MAG: pirin family protein [Gemmatimonadaceae bacterium]|nr:pirin family protein [Gemmatimonadaceae bacterium]
MIGTIVGGAPARRVRGVIDVPPHTPGFGGEGHLASFVIKPDRFSEQDPFLVLADDMLDMPPGANVGGAHPHAGFEIVTYAVSGHLDEGPEGELHEGDVQFTTAGMGVVHGEQVRTHQPTRILQLWVALPESQQWTVPGVSVMRRAQAQHLSASGVDVRRYRPDTGASHTIVPVTVVDIRLDPNARHALDVPAADTAFVYVLEGAVSIGGDTAVEAGQVAWFSPLGGAGDSTVLFESGAQGARLVLYSAPPQGGTVTMHGSFVGRTPSDISRMFRAYARGEFTRAGSIGVREY